VDWVVEQQIPGTFTFDRDFTNASVRTHGQGQQRAYGAL